MHLKNGKKLYNERGITFFHETERYVNNLNIYNRSKNGTNLWDDLIFMLGRWYIYTVHVNVCVSVRGCPGLSSDKRRLEAIRRIWRSRLTTRVRARKLSRSSECNIYV